MPHGGSTPTTTPTELRLVSVNVARPRPVGRLRSGASIVSGIGKRPVAADTACLDVPNLEGDGQVDLSVHGGQDKAVYGYPTEHLPRWNGELGVAFGPGTFGENLSTEGLLEDEVRIGGVWAWGDVRLQGAQPRSPCDKPTLVTGRPDLPQRLVRRGRTDWYLRVLEPGRVPVAGPISVLERHPAGVTALRAHRASQPGANRAELKAVVAVEPLAAAWRGWLLTQLGRS